MDFLIWNLIFNALVIRVRETKRIVIYINDLLVGEFWE